MKGYQSYKLGVCSILGFILGWVVGKTGLGLLLGLFFGLAMETSNVSQGA